MQMPEEEKYLMSKDEMLAEIVVLLAGRAAEEVKFNSITTGASNDIERATAMARAMISQYGMSERFDMMQLESIQNRYLDGRAVTNCGEQTIAVLDGEVLELIKKSHKKAVELISSQREALDELSSFLIKRETITGEEFMDILKKYTEPEEETVKTAIEDNEKEDENQKN
ncbi:MAG: AAA family ATPase, partial [Firmicutes bacterium]|nr:AAA family ATPase [Bacillota bacterium]